MLIFSCHADTGFPSHQLAVSEAKGFVNGHLDNFVGVHALMNAYFSGRLDHDHVRIELTHGEETDFAGALEVLQTLRPHDWVIVIDVTATPTRKDFVFEKCTSPVLKAFFKETLKGMRYDLHKDCPDPISDQDETNVYRLRCPEVCFLGIPCRGGDYNEGRVKCSSRSIAAVTEAICRIVEGYEAFCKEREIPVV